MARRRTPEIKRSRHRREPKRRFIVYCEGGKTEPAYLVAFRRAFAGALIEIEMIAPAGVPRTIADKAASCAGTLSRHRHRNSFEEHDQVWAVFDRDDHPRFGEAVNLCEQAGVGVARSNPCFELWLILHEADYDKPDGRHAVQAHLKKLRPEYDKDGAKMPDCADLVTRVEAAEQRADRQLANRAAEGTPYGRPSTTVVHLTRAIRDAVESAT